MSGTSLEKPVGESAWRLAARKWGSVVCVSTADYDAPLWTNKQHIMSRLSQELPVLYVESLGLRAPRLSRADLARLARRARRSVSDVAVIADSGSLPALHQLTVASPKVVPAHARRWQRSLNRRLLTRQLQPLIEVLPRPHLLWTYNPVVIDELMLDGYHTIVYHCVDDLATIPGVDPRSISSTEARLARRADVVFASSDALAARLSTYHPGGVRLLRNVADFEFFSSARLPGPVPSDLQAIPEPRAVFIGALSDHKVDSSLVAAVARLRPDWQFVFVGPHSAEYANPNIRRIGKQPNIHFLGYRAYVELPDYLRGASVGLIPYRISKHTDSVFPLKTWEYLAAGLPVVTTPLPAVVAAAPPVHVASTAPDFAAALSALDQPALHERVAAARTATWDTLLDAMLNLLPLSQ